MVTVLGLGLGLWSRFPGCLGLMFNSYALKFAV